MAAASTARPTAKKPRAPPRAPPSAPRRRNLESRQWRRRGTTIYMAVKCCCSETVTATAADRTEQVGASSGNCGRHLRWGGSREEFAEPLERGVMKRKRIVESNMGAAEVVPVQTMRVAV